MKIKKKVLFIIILLALYAADCAIAWALLTVVSWLIGLPISAVVVGAAGFIILVLQVLMAAG